MISIFGNGEFVFCRGVLPTGPGLGYALQQRGLWHLDFQTAQFVKNSAGPQMGTRSFYLTYNAALWPVSIGHPVVATIKHIGVEGGQGPAHEFVHVATVGVAQP